MIYWFQSHLTELSNQKRRGTLVGFYGFTSMDLENVIMRYFPIFMSEPANKNMGNLVIYFEISSTMELQNSSNKIYLSY